MFSLGVIWQAGSYLAADDVPPGPVASVLAVGQSSREGYLWSDIAITTYTVSGAFLIAFVAAVAIGALLGRSQLAERLFRPWVTIGASIPPLVVIVIVYLTVGCWRQRACARNWWRCARRRRAPPCS
jgi:ABC-type nitrate/sulfonate/bicarbonate transport system permease component